MSTQTIEPSGFVARCPCGCGVAVAGMDRTRTCTPGKMLGDWLMRGCTVEPRYGSWSDRVEPCRAAEGEAADDTLRINYERLEQVLVEVRAREASLERERESLRATLRLAKAAEHWHTEQCTLCAEIDAAIARGGPRGETDARASTGDGA